ncbi:MAG: CHASE2 domain-containing protein [Sulfuritalea sp.]|nr:CHASE2 domain-containing protein [Sulfuritalea sp.]
MSAVSHEGLLHRLQAGTVSLVRRLGARTYLILAAVFSLLIVADIGLLNLVSAAETRLFDLLISHRIATPKADPDIVILDIDEASLAGMAAQYGRWPWPNSVFGELVDGIEKQKPRAIVFDILFSDRDTQRPESDAAFNAVIARSTTTFFPMLRLDPQNDRLSRIPTGLLPGVRPLAGAGDAAAHIAMILPKVPAAIDNGRLGTHQVTPDKDGVIRRYPAWLEHAGWRIPSLPQRVTEEFGFPGVERLDRREVLLNWRGPPFTYRYVSLVDLYRDLKSAKPQRPADEFAGKIVIIGSTAPSLFDVKGTPVARIHPGVEILATAIDNFKNGDALRERPSWIMISAALLLIWSMAIALYRQVHIDVFDTVFGVLQGGLVLIAYAVVNASAWYLDTSAPLSLGVMYFTVARVYYGIAQGWLAGSQINGLTARPAGTGLLAVLALRLDGATAAERRRFKGELDRLVARSTLGPGRISRLIEDPGLIQEVFTGTMLVYWLAENPALDWCGDASRIEEALRCARPKQHWDRRLVCARHSSLLSWQTTEEWNTAAASTILAALTATLTPSPETPR